LGFGIYLIIDACLLEFFILFAQYSEKKHIFNPLTESGLITNRIPLTVNIIKKM